MDDWTIPAGCVEAYFVKFLMLLRRSWTKNEESYISAGQVWLSCTTLCWCLRPMCADLLPSRKIIVLVSQRVFICCSCLDVQVLQMTFFIWLVDGMITGCMFPWKHSASSGMVTTLSWYVDHSYRNKVFKAIRLGQYISTYLIITHLFKYTFSLLVFRCSYFVYMHVLFFIFLLRQL